MALSTLVAVAIFRLVFLLGAFYHGASAGRISLDADRGYVDIVVAIRGDVSEKKFPTLLAELQQGFTEASGYLHTATRQLTYFKEIRILIPESWADSNTYTEVTWENIQNSDIIVRPHNKKFAPYVVNYRGCAAQGEQMVLTPDYITDGAHKNYGPPKKTLIHEWGHLRWGLFDEYPYPNNPSDKFYWNPRTDKFEGTRCVEAIPGNIVTKSGAVCNGRPDPDRCSFRPSKGGIYSASIMYNQHLPPVLTFCDNSSDPGTLHNIHASNNHNRICKQKSAWEVMREHSDFQGTSGMRPKPRKSTVPKFVLVKDNNKLTSVMVLDRSGSMSGQRLIRLRQAAASAIRDIFPLGSRVGIVSFNSYAVVSSNIVGISSEADRELLINAIPKYASGGTSIGAGIRQAAQLLKSDIPHSHKRMLVISDGQENESPYIRDVIDEVMKNNIVIDTIAIGPDADRALEGLSSATQGLHFTHVDGSTSLYSSFLRLANDIPDSSTGNGISIAIDTSSEYLDTGDNVTKVFYLDEDLTGSLKVVMSYINNFAFYGVAQLMDPHGLTYHTSLDVFVDDINIKQAIFNIQPPDVQVGYWHLYLENNGGRDTFFIFIQPTSVAGTTPTLATSSWALSRVDPPKRQILYVVVSKDLTPVIDTDVTAVVSVNLASGIVNDHILVPRDDGAGADVTKNDGVYSAYFTKFSGEGRYGVQVHIQGTSESQLAEGALVGFGSPPIIDDDGNLEPAQISYRPTGPFQREIIGESFICGNSSCLSSLTNDLYPPSDVTDLKATDVDPHNRTIIITFTAPGDDLSEGNASGYEFHYALNFSELVYHFEDTGLIPGDWFVVGNISAPRPSGSQEVFIIEVNETEHITYNIAVVAVDDEDNRSDRSNIVTSLGSMFTNDSEPSTVWIIGTVVGLIVVASILVVGIVYYKKGRPKPQTTIQ